MTVAEQIDATNSEALAIALLSEITMADQLSKARLQKALPKGMELSHFTLMNHLAHLSSERSPAQLARAFHVTKAAMTNTLGKLEKSGYVHIRPDWEDARKKLVSLSPAGRSARDAATQTIGPVFAEIIERIGTEDIRAALPFLRRLRSMLAEDPPAI